MKSIKLLALSGVGALLLAAAPTQAEGIVIPIDISGTPSHDGLGAPGNAVLVIDLAAALGQASGTKVTMNGIGWDVVLTTFGASWLSEAQMAFGDSAGNIGLFLTPGAADGFADPDVPHSYSSGGIVKLGGAGIPDLQLPDGILVIEFFESFDDVAGADDAVWKSGTLFIQVIPAPGALALIGLAGLFGAPRRRRT